MKAIAMPWLPPPLEGEVAATVACIAGRWLADWSQMPARLRVDAITPPGGGISGWQARSGAWCRADFQDTIALGNVACAGQVDGGNPLDEVILRVIGRAMLDDLIDRMAMDPGKDAGLPGGLSAADAGPGARPEVFRIVEDVAGWCLLLALDGRAIVQARKTAAGSSRHLEVMPMASALVNEDVEIGCHLGETHLTVAEISALSIGDVIVLDRDLHGSVPLTVAGFVPQAGAARIGSEGGKIQVTVTEAPSLLRKN